MEVAVVELLILREAIFVNKQLFKEEFLKAPILKDIEKELDSSDEIIAVLIAGSAAINMLHEKSDIDVAILTKKSWELAPFINGDFQGYPVHWWVTPYDFGIKCYLFPKYTQVLLAGNYYMTFEDNENFIYLNPKYEKLISFLKQTKPEIQFFSAYSLVEYFKNTQQIYAWKAFTQILPPKTAAPLLDFYYKQNNLKLNKDLIFKLKKLKSFELKLTKEENTELRNALLWVCDYFDKTDKNYVTYLAKWSETAQQILKDCENNN